MRGQHEVEQLRVPVVGREGPAVVEDDGPGVSASPVLVVDLRAVFDGDVGNDRSSGSCGWVRSIRACSRQPRHPLTRSYICTDVRGGAASEPKAMRHCGTLQLRDGKFNCFRF